MINIPNLANGAVAERINEEMQKVLDNIADPNTDPTKARKLTITVTVKADEERDVAHATVQAKATLVPAYEIGTKLLIDTDREGQVVGRELKSGAKGQMFIDVQASEVRQDDGGPVEPEDKVINLRQQQN